MKNNTMNNSILSDNLLNKLMDAKLAVSKSEFRIAVSNYQGIHSYCLTLKTVSDFHFLLCKSVKNKREFEREVDNLAKYFNAVILKEI